MNIKLVFPFGSELKKVEQIDRSPKRVFVLGVYASAVHAKWLNDDGKVLVNALAVASEPYIFWKGENSEVIINGISIPNGLGKLIPADKKFNGPSGITLDTHFLEPLGYNRKDVWLCDIIPFSRINPNQQKAIRTHYHKAMTLNVGIPLCTIPEFSKTELNNSERRQEILLELMESKADTIILLGDQPIRYFLSYFINNSFKKLSDFGENVDKYGQIHNFTIAEKYYNVIPLVHPRQAGALGLASSKWYRLHQEWMKIQQERIN